MGRKSSSDLSSRYSTFSKPASTSAARACASTGSAGEPRPSFLRGVEEYRGKLRRDCPLGRRQPCIARRQRQPVSLPDGFARHDLDRDVEIARHAADDMKLLEILLAEECQVGAGLQEQFCDDGGDAIEMAGPERAAKALRHTIHRDHRREAVRIDLRSVRRVEKMRADGQKLLRIVMLGARIGGEIGRAVELFRVDEEGDDDPIGPRAALARTRLR